MLCLVERKTRGRLGSSAAAPLVASRRSTQEKAPWKTLPPIESPVEREFLRPVYLGESILPFRVWKLFEGVVPVDAKGNMLNAKAAADRGVSGLAAWMGAAELAWNGSSAGNMTLIDRWNYHNELSSQFPTSPLRVVFSASGTHPAATVLRNSEGVVEHSLYVATPDSEGEAYFLVAVLNSEEARRRVANLQPRGQFGARHFDKVMFTLPIPRFQAFSALHAELESAGREAEALTAEIVIPEATPFARARRAVRDQLRAHGVSDRIDGLVSRLLDSH
jgi:hypothetical protein